jgi:hypothetical protein
LETVGVVETSAAETDAYSVMVAADIARGEFGVRGGKIFDAGL